MVQIGVSDTCQETIKKISSAQIINMDEVPLTFDSLHSKTVNTTDEKLVKFITIGNEKTAFMCVLTCVANDDN